MNCGSVIDETRPYSLCDKCMDRFHWVTDHTCKKCGKILGDSYAHDLCTDCREISHVFDRGFTCVQYGLYEKNVIAEYKYRGKSYIGRNIADIMYDRMAGEDLTYDLITAVPIHSSRLKTRGFNQAALVAGLFAEMTGVPFRELLVRAKHTDAMKSLGVFERAENVRGAFRAADGISETIDGNDVLLIDDIYTTGATADSCAAALKKAGASKVYLLTFAAGGNLVMPADQPE